MLKCGNLRREMSGGFAHTTNNRMELMAVIEGLKAIRWEHARVEVWSDSKYVVDALQKGWLEGWIAKGWKKVKNPDLWRRLALKGFFMGCDGVVLPSVAGDSLAAAAMRDSLTDIALLSQVLRLSHRLMLCEKDFKVKLEGRMGCFWVDHLGGDQTDDVPLLRLEALARLVRLQAFVDTWCK